MFYRPADGHGLPHSPFSAIVSPRPIGWISSRGADGRDNLAPYSFFNAVAYTPPQVMFSATNAKPENGEVKDSLANIRETGVFCVNIVEYAAREVMNATSAGFTHDIDEFDHAGITKAACDTIDCPRVDGAPAALECKLTQLVELPGGANTVAFGEVTGIHMRDDCLVEGIFDVTRYQPVSRLGYRDYAVVTELFQMTRPKP